MQVARTARPMRADAAANRERIIAAAMSLFAEAGREASLEAVAQLAGVGIGTLYRHFPSREELAAAVYCREVDQLTELAKGLEADGDAVAALRRWLRATVAFVATKKGMAAALALAARMPADLASYPSEQLTAALGRLMHRATAGGKPRPGIGPQDLLQMLVALCYEFDAPDWQAKVGLLLDIVVDGLCGQGE